MKLVRWGQGGVPATPPTGSRVVQCVQQVRLILHEEISQEGLAVAIQKRSCQTSSSNCGEVPSSLVLSPWKLGALHSKGLS